MATETILDKFVTELKFRTDARALSRLEARVRKLRARLDTVARGAAVAGTALTTAGAGALTAFARYEKGFAEMAAKTGKNFVELEKEYGPTVRKIARETGVSIAEIQGGFQKGISAGLEGEALIRAVTQATKAQAAGIGSLEDTISSATTAWSVLGVDADKAMDIITASAQVGEGETADFGQALKGLVGFGKTLGIDFTDLAAGIAAVSQAAKSVPVGETQLRGFMKALISPSEQAKKTLEELGLGLTHEDLRATAKNKGLYAVFSDIQQMFADMKAQGKDIAPIVAKLFPEVEAQQFVSTINAMKIKDLREDIEDAGPAIDKAFGQGAKTVYRQWTRMVQSFHGAAITIGLRLVPAFEAVTKVFDGLVTGFDAMPDIVKDIIAGFLTLGPVLLGISAVLVGISKGIALVVTAFKIARFAALLFWGAVSAPVTAILLLIASVAAAAYLIWDNWDRIVGWLRDLWQDFVDWMRKILPESLSKFLFGEGTSLDQKEAAGFGTGSRKPAQKPPTHDELKAQVFGLAPKEVPGVNAPLPTPEASGVNPAFGALAAAGEKITNISIGDINIEALGADADSLFKDANRAWQRQVLIAAEHVDSEIAN